MKRLLLLVVILVGCVLGAAAGFFSIDAKYWIYGPRYSSGGEGIGGAFQGLIEGVYAMCAGAFVGARVAWLGGGLVSRLTWRRSVVGGHLVWGDVVVLGILVLWMYLIWATW
jgi:hypothetical protein